MRRRAPFVLLLASASALANIAAVEPGSDPVRTEVVSEKLSVDCTAEPCRFEAAYALRNPGSAPESLTAEFVGLRTSEISVELDGKAVPSQRVELMAQTVRELRPVISAITEKLPGADYGDLQRVGFALDVPPGREVPLVVRGAAKLQRRHLGGFGLLPAIQARHLLMAGDAQDELMELDVLTGPIRTWAGDPKIDVSVRFPAALEFDGSQAEGTPEVGWQLERRGAAAEARAEVQAKSLGDRLRFGFIERRSPLYAGGPQLAFGTVFGGGARFLLRAGYQVALPVPILLHTLSLESDLSSLTASYLFQAASPQILIVPSLGFGVGAVGRLLPDTRFGLRVLADLHFFSFGFAFAWDYFPAAGAGGDQSQLSLVAQLAL